MLCKILILIPTSKNRPPVLRGRNFKPRAGGLWLTKLALNWYVTSGWAPTANMSEARLCEQVSYLAPALLLPDGLLIIQDVFPLVGCMSLMSLQWIHIQPVIMDS